MVFFLRANILTCTYYLYGDFQKVSEAGQLSYFSQYNHNIKHTFQKLFKAGYLNYSVFTSPLKGYQLIGT